ncbi:hypothetical protein [Streptomyces canus]|uniref:hypothetical protein n=1 Tax=Streptomyces canus TaxID=58343 RepID=UPI0027D86E76|nr:hypothetical protein [Streptomyces canus]
MFALLILQRAGRPQPAARLLAAAGALRSRTGAGVERERADRLRAAVDELRRRLGGAVFATAWAEGLRLRPEAMAAEALGTAEPGRAEGSPAPHRHRRTAPPPPPGHGRPPTSSGMSVPAGRPARSPRL